MMCKLHKPIFYSHQNFEFSSLSIWDRSNKGCYKAGDAKKKHLEEHLVTNEVNEQQVSDMIRYKKSILYRISQK